MIYFFIRKLIIYLENQIGKPIWFSKKETIKIIVTTHYFEIKLESEYH